MSEAKVYLNNNRQPIWPDTSGLSKGDMIPQSMLEEIINAKPGTARYAFKLLWLKRKVTKDLASRSVFATVVIRKAALVILTDAEAEVYNFHFAGTGACRVRRATARHAAIDLSRLTPQQRLDWDRNQARLSMMVSGLKMKELPKAEPHRRIE